MAVLTIGLFILGFLSQFENGISVDNQPEKRLLVDDPTTLQQRLQDMDVKLEHMASQIEARQKVESQLEANIQSLESQIEVRKNKEGQLEAKVQSLENLISSTASQGLGGAMYVRWGRTVCPSNETELVYSGYTGGSWYNHTGAAAEYVCLPRDPQWGSHYTDKFDRAGRIFGAEYEEDGYFKLGYTNDAPCAVCRSTVSSSHMMIPGRKQCYPGWRYEYSGNLASGSYLHKAASQYVCLDENPEILPHGSRGEDGKLFYAVEGTCGSLPCPPYVNGRELTCVVCTK